MRYWQQLLLVLAALGLSFAGYVFWVAWSLEVEQVSPDLYVLYGAGGNVAVLDSDDGTVIVDSMSLEYQGRRIREVAEGLTGKPVVMVINTHYHLDHTHGNPAFEPGIRVVATERTLQHLNHTDAEYFSGPAAELLPNETFEHEHHIKLGNKNLTLVWPGRGHTDGDLVVLFEEEQAIHTGDLFFHGHYPNIDLAAGGSVRAWGETIDRVFELPFRTVIPGHGPLTGPDQLRQFQQFVVQLATLATTAVGEGVTEADFIRTAALTEDAGYSEIRMIVPLGLDRDFVLGRAWQEASTSTTP